MSRHEYARLLGERVLQLQVNPRPLVPVDRKVPYNPFKIAHQEIVLGVCPLLLKRFLPDGSFELWSVDEMICPDM